MKKQDILGKSLSLNKWSVVLTILLLSLLLTGAFISYSISNTIPQMIEKQKNTNIGARLLFVIPDDLTWQENEMEQLAQREHVELLFSQEEGYWGDTVDTGIGQMNASFLGSTDSMLPQDIIVGKNRDLENYEILLPSKIVLTDGKKHKGEDFLGHTFSANVRCPTYIDESNIDPSKTKYYNVDFKVVGIYDETAQVTSENQLFTTMETVKQLNQISNGNLYDYLESHQSMLLLTDSYTHAQILEMQLKSEGYLVNIGLFFDYALLYGTQYLSAAICLITVLLSCFIIYFLCKRNIRKQSTDIGILKIIGYADKQILKIVAEQSIKLFLLAMVIAIFCYGLIYPLIDHALFSVAYIPIFSVYFVLGAAALLILVPSMNIWLLSRQLKQISPINILKDAG